MEIPLNAQVECSDGVCGRSMYVLINPIMNDITHVVVRGDNSPNSEYLVPVEFIDETIADTIRLSCGKTELEKMELFNQTDCIEEKGSDMYISNRNVIGGVGTTFFLPYVTADRSVETSVNYQQIPPGQLAVHRGTRVEATDGYVGTVDEFVVDPKSCQITHLVMREGHLWGQKDVIIPLSTIGDTLGDTVFLKLDKHQIETLPTFPVNRRWS